MTLSKLSLLKRAKSRFGRLLLSNVSSARECIKLRPPRSYRMEAMSGKNWCTLVVQKISFLLTKSIVDFLQDKPCAVLLVRIRKALSIKSNFSNNLKGCVVVTLFNSVKRNTFMCKALMMVEFCSISQVTLKTSGIPEETLLERRENECNLLRQSYFVRLGN